VHGRRCYGDDGTLSCAWPEQHDPAFTEPAHFPKDRPVAKARSIGRLIAGLLTALIVAASVGAVALVILECVANLRY
jgi:hypothetical protein